MALALISGSSGAGKQYQLKASKAAAYGSQRKWRLAAMASAAIMAYHGNEWHGIAAIMA